MDGPASTESQDSRVVGKLPSQSSFSIVGDATKPPRPVARTLITLGSWVLLIVFASGVWCCFTLTFMKEKILYSDTLFASAVGKVPALRHLLDEHYSNLCWAAFALFLLSAIGAGGALRRKVWSAKWLRFLSYLWCAAPALFIAWWIGSVWGLIGTESPIDTFGLIVCAAVFPLSYIVRHVLEVPQLKLELCKPKPAMIAFMPGMMMLPDLDLKLNHSAPAPSAGAAPAK